MIISHASLGRINMSYSTTVLTDVIFIYSQTKNMMWLSAYEVVYDSELALLKQSGL